MRPAGPMAFLFRTFVLSLLLIAQGQLKRWKGIGSTSRADVAILLDDASPRGDTKALELGGSLVLSLIDRLNVSASWARVSFAMARPGFEKKWLFFTYNRYFNRECLVKAIEEMLNTETRFVNDATLNWKTQTKLHDMLLKDRRPNSQHHIILIAFYATDISLTAKERKLIERFHYASVIRIGADEMKARQRKEKANKMVLESLEDIGDIVNVLSNGAGSMTSCLSNESSKVTDNCLRECDCVAGQLTNCVRVRKEFTDMTHGERRRYLKVYKAMTTDPLYKEKYEHFIFMHFKYFCWGIHELDLFCPWHRWYLWQFENLLREVDCRVTVPYWDWSDKASDPWNTTHIWSDTDYGLGGNGDKNRGYCVQDGLFREGKWKTPFFEDSLDVIQSSIDQTGDNISSIKPDLSYCLRRSFHGHPFPSQHIREALATPLANFTDFEVILRHTYHDVIHNLIGGTMSTHYAGETPEFWFHHSFLDKIWYEWQMKSTRHKFVYFENLERQKMLGCPFHHMEFIDSHDMPGCAAVVYTRFGETFRERRETDEDYYGKEIDDQSRVPISYWNGILEASDQDTFPNCKRSKAEEQRSKNVSRRIFKTIHMQYIDYK